MTSFEDLGLDAAVVDGLAAEGMEVPTPLQEAAIPVVRRGNNLIARSGPGAGVLVAYGAPLLDRLDAGGGKPAAIVLSATRGSAAAKAVALGRIAEATGHVVAALGGSWAFPERADVLFTTPSDFLDACHEGGVECDAVATVIVDDASSMEALDTLAAAEDVLPYLPDATQRVVVALPITPLVGDFCDRLVKRAVTVPAEGGDSPPGSRGELRYRIADGPKVDAALSLLADEFADDARHVAVFFRNEDAAAEVGDVLGIHGYRAGPPGDGAVPVWLAVDEMEARHVLDDSEGVRVMSFDVPAGPDSLDRRHGGGRGGTVVLLPRETAHFRDVARRTGYAVKPSPPPAGDGPDALGGTLERIRTAAADHDVDAYQRILEPLFEEMGPAEVAAAALALLRSRTPAASAPEPPREHGKAPEAFVRLFVSVGERDRLRPGELLGAITGETGMDGSRVGRIEIKDTFSLVEVPKSVAGQVIDALNGTTIKGRAARVDYDRGRKRAPTKGRRKHGARD